MGSKGGRPGNPPREKQCAECGKTFVTRAQRIGQINYYCGKPCELAYKRAHRTIEHWW